MPHEREMWEVRNLLLRENILLCACSFFSWWSLPLCVLCLVLSYSLLFTIHFSIHFFSDRVCVWVAALGFGWAVVLVPVFWFTYCRVRAVCLGALCFVVLVTSDRGVYRETFVVFASVYYDVGEAVVCWASLYSNVLYILLFLCFELFAGSYHIGGRHEDDDRYPTVQNILFEISQPASQSQ